MIQKHNLQNLTAMDAKFRVKLLTKELAESDATMVRALEDLLIVLLKKKVISSEDIHPLVVEKIKHRRKLRDEIRDLQSGVHEKVVKTGGNAA